jgi:hypothetical protein
MPPKTTPNAPVPPRNTRTQGVKSTSTPPSTASRRPVPTENHAEKANNSVLAGLVRAPAPPAKGRNSASTAPKTTNSGAKSTVKRSETLPKDRAFTKTIENYLVWLEKQTGPFVKIEPKRLAGLAITMYSQYQKSPERIADRAKG